MSFNEYSPTSVHTPQTSDIVYVESLEFRPVFRVGLLILLLHIKRATNLINKFPAPELTE